MLAGAKRAASAALPPAPLPLAGLPPGLGISGSDFDLEEEDHMACLVALAAYRRSQRQRFYLTSDVLLPKEDYEKAPAVHLLRQGALPGASPAGYITTMGVDPATFYDHLLPPFATVFDSHPVPKTAVEREALIEHIRSVDNGEYTQATKKPRLKKRRITADIALSIVLHYLNSTCGEKHLQLMFALPPATLNRYINWGMMILDHVTATMPICKVVWPDEQKMQEYTEYIYAREPRMLGAFAFADGLNLPVGISNNPITDNAQYNGWTCSHYCSSTFCFAPDGTVIWCNLNCPGSWHDSAISAGLYRRLEDDTAKGWFVITDSAFPMAFTNQKIRAVLKDDSKVWANATGAVSKALRKKRSAATPEEHERASLEHAKAKTHLANLALDQTALTSARQAAEWGMRALQGSFGRLRLPLDPNDHAGRTRLLRVCVRIHQLRCRAVGINQLQNVFVRAWKDNDKHYDDFEKLFFKDIMDNDRISRYYNLPRIGDEDV